MLQASEPVLGPELPRPLPYLLYPLLYAAIIVVVVNWCRISELGGHARRYVPVAFLLNALRIE